MDWPFGTGSGSKLPTAASESGQADQQEAGNPARVQPVAVAVGAVLRQVGEHAV